MKQNPLIHLSEEVQNAFEKKQPIVALESTIITHGMAYPTNLTTAQQVEKTIRDQGVVPATIAILQGKIHVGLTEDQLQSLAQQKDVIKCSRRDLSLVIAKKQYGSTTVAATMMICKMVGIKIFATGGIGGVHRFGENTMDVSADLRELGQTDIAVVCAGAKSILDIKRTLEYLETEGVPVVGYKTEKFPAFFTSDSGFKCSGYVQDAQQMANMVLSYNQDQRILIANPIPEKDAGDGQKIQQAIDQAIQESLDQNIDGKEATPFLLKRINEITKGESSISNVALIVNNARVGAEIALQYNKIIY